MLGRVRLITDATERARMFDFSNPTKDTPEQAKARSIRIATKWDSEANACEANAASVESINPQRAADDRALAQTNRAHASWIRARVDGSTPDCECGSFVHDDERK